MFGRLQAIRSIVNALTASLVPVVNAFFIMAVVISRYAMVNMHLYDDRSPQDFGNLSCALISISRIALGETWHHPQFCIYSWKLTLSTR